MRRCDVVVVGGGPSGSAAGWMAARNGADVVVCDKAVFPRDKPCGDGITPRAIRLLNDMGLGAELSRFQPVDRIRLFGAGRVRNTKWPARRGYPSHGYVIPRTELDVLVLQAANRAGARVLEATRVVEPIVEDGIVRGVRVTSNGREEDIRADVVIAADGASSPLGRALDIVPASGSATAFAVRAQVECRRSEPNVLEAYATLTENGRLLPGYGWVFPMSDGRVNVGVGFITRPNETQMPNLARVMDSFVDSLPAEWELPSLKEVRKAGLLKGWQLPMGMVNWPPWRPGFLAVGDAASVIKPTTGAGISRGLHSGLIGGDAAVAALDKGGPTDLSPYAARLEAIWGSYYRNGMAFHRLVAEEKKMERVTSVGMKFLPAFALGVRLFLGVRHGNREMDLPIRHARVKQNGSPHPVDKATLPEHTEEPSEVV